MSKKSSNNFFSIEENNEIMKLDILAERKDAYFCSGTTGRHHYLFAWLEAFHRKERGYSIFKNFASVREEL